MGFNTKDYDLSRCSMCGEEIVGTLSELIELPMCNRLKCFKRAFPDDYEDLVRDINESKNKVH